MSVSESEIEELWSLGLDLFPRNRSIMGPGFRESLKILGQSLPGLQVKSVDTGYQAFDWIVPDEWEVTEAFILGPDGGRVIDFLDNNLHVVGYSSAVDLELSLEELSEHLFSLPDQPQAIPYVTSYYEDNWGFCLAHEQRETLKPGQYRAVIKSTKKPGRLVYGEVFLEGKSAKEIFFSTYLCHPSMANNELSGPLVLTQLLRKIAQANRKHSIRAVIIPETIGSLTYLSKNLSHLKANVVAGVNLSCVGDERCYSYLPTRRGGTLSDRALMSAISSQDDNFKKYSWLDRGSDERQYCAPGIDLPIASFMKSKYGEYPEYHTSLDRFETVVTKKGLKDSVETLLKFWQRVEGNCYPTATMLGEPQLGRRDLYPTTSIKRASPPSRSLLNILSLSDGKTDLLQMEETLNLPFEEVLENVENLEQWGLLSRNSRL